MNKKILVTGGAGYVGSVLIPKLLRANYSVKVLDLYIYGDSVFGATGRHPNLEKIKGDIRDRTTLEKAIQNCDTLIHLACISNDPSFDLNPDLGKSVNYDAFLQLVDVAQGSGLRHFIYASSSSVYGIQEKENITEELPLKPLTDYSKYKAMCEEVLLKKREKNFTTLIVRPATVCGYAPRLRLDLTVNILTNHAFHNRAIKVFGGEQMRPNIHVEDMANFYLQALQWPAEKVDGKIYNVGYENCRVSEIAKKVQSIVGKDVRIVTTTTDDNRSYHISSEKIKKELGFEAQHTIEDAVQSLVSAFQEKKVPNAMTDPSYYNIKTMQQLNLS